MSKLSQTFRQVFAIRSAVHVNTFLYYLKRIPLIGRAFPDTLYADDSLKRILTVLVELFIQIGKFFMKGVYLFAACIAPTMLIAEKGTFSRPGFVHILFFMSCVIGSIHESAIFNVSQEKFIGVKYLRMDPARVTRAAVLEKNIPHFLYLLPFLLAAFLLLGGSVWEALGMWIALIAFRFAGEAFQLWFYDRTKTVFSRRTVLVWLCYLLLVPVAYLPVFLGVSFPTEQILLSVPGLLVCVLLGAASVWYVLWGYRRYDTTIRRSLDQKFLFANLMKESKRSSSFRDVAVREKDLAQSEPKTREYAGRLKGYAYLNALFFSRHRRMLFRPVALILIVVALLFVAGCVLYSADRVLTRTLLLKLGQTLPAFVFLMYLASMVAEKACRAMFYNCDISLLRYGFYRRREVILQNFRIRLFRVTAYTACIALAIDAAIVALVAISGTAWNPIDLLMFAASILLLSILFSVHHLFMYYVFQPYTTELDVKNPFFRVINGVVYAICFLCLQIQTANRTFTFVVLAVTVLYILAALLLVWRLAPKTFRVK